VFEKLLDAKEGFPPQNPLKLAVRSAARKIPCGLDPSEKMPLPEKNEF